MGTGICLARRKTTISAEKLLDLDWGQQIVTTTPDSVTAQYTDTNRNSQFACANGYERHCKPTSRSEYFSVIFPNLGRAAASSSSAKYLQVIQRTTCTPIYYLGCRCIHGQESKYFSHFSSLPLLGKLVDVEMLHAVPKIITILSSLVLLSLAMITICMV